MKVTKEAFENAQENHAGFCTECQAFVSEDVEPDAKDYECPECGHETMMGAEEALVMSHILIEGEDDDGDDILSWDDEDLEDE